MVHAVHLTVKTEHIIVETINGMMQISRLQHRHINIIYIINVKYHTSENSTTITTQIHKTTTANHQIKIQEHMFFLLTKQI